MLAAFIIFILLLLVSLNVFLIIKCLQQKKRLTYLNYIKEVAENSKDIIYYCLVDPILKYIYLSPSIENLLGQNIVERNMKNPYTLFELCHLEDYPLLEKKFSGELDYNKPLVFRLKNEKGQYLWFEDFIIPIYKNNKLTAIGGIIRNIDEKIAFTKKLEYKAFHDALTNMYNREYFDQLMEKYNKHKNVSIAIVMCDLDGLKYVNDNFGHKAGDTLIQETAKIFQQYSNNKDVITMRIGGDEFVAILINQEPSAIERFIENIRKSIAHYNLQNPETQINLSIGYSHRKASIGNMEKILVEADENMYKEKKEKKKLSEVSK